MDILLTTMVGLENTVLKEVKQEFGLKGERVRNGRVIVKGEEEDIVRLNYAGRTFERVMIVLAVERAENLEDIYSVIASMPLEEYFGPEKTFACRSDRMGEHPFTSLDIERTAGQAVVDRFLEKTGKRIRANLKEPDVIVRADLDGDALYVSIDTTGYEALHRRGYRVYDHPAALNAALASAMLFESGWGENKTLLDPFCGGGTILIEAALKVRRIPWFRFRSFLFERSEIIDAEIAENIRKELEEQMDERKTIKAVGIEKFIKHVRGALENARSAGVLDTLEIREGDARKIDVDADVIVTNPPYGQRIANPHVVHSLYYAFAESAAERSIPTIVTITSRWKWMEDALRNAGYKIEKSAFVLYGKLHTHLIRARLK